jgi:hypothetical protein
MSKSKIQFDHNIKKIKQEREFKKLLQQEKQFDNRDTYFKNTYWIR